MLSVSEIEAGSLKLQVGDVRLDALFPELQDDYNAQALSKDMKLRFELPPKFPVIRADRDKLSVVLHNLLGNALKYTPAGGEVTVHVEADDRELRVDVKDNGIGIAEPERERIFEKFYRAKDKRVDHVSGTGLGLAIAREIARLHGGDISVESVLNQGSTFTLRLPASPQKPTGARLAA
jgi:signal transduction histidine kinase